MLTLSAVCLHSCVSPRLFRYGKSCQLFICSVSELSVHKTDNAVVGSCLSEIHRAHERDTKNHSSHMDLLDQILFPGEAPRGQQEL